MSTGKLEFVPAPRRLLVVWRADIFSQSTIHDLCDKLYYGENWKIWAIATYDMDAPDIRIFDLNGAPAPDSGLIQQLIASVVEKKPADACEECEGSGLVCRGDRVTCLGCGGSGKRKSVASA